MATVNKDFRVKHGLVVEGSTGTIGGNDILVDGDSLDLLVEGTTNLFYTDQKVKNVLTGSTQTNISITEVEGDLVITAESGIEDATTDDLDEGTTNLYFTEQKARDSVSAGDGIDYDSSTGVISVDYADGLTVNETDQLIVDTDTIATKAYVDTVAEGLHIHASSAAATDEPLADTTSNTVTYDNSTGTLTLSTSLTTLDSVTLTNGMRILVKNEGDAGGEGAEANGIYTWATGGTVLTRAVDFNTAEEIAGGDFTFVTGGTKYNNTGWVQTEPVNTLGSDSILWSQFSGAGTFTGGTGIDINGEEINIDFTEFDTDDIDEGTTNLYYTDARVKTLLTGSTQTNISITEVEGNLVITAENGVDDANTDDLDEGTTNLYFTDSRAVDAIEAVVPDFEAVVINAVAKQASNSILVESTSTPEAVLTFAKASYRSAKLLVKTAFGSHTEISELLLTLDSSDNIAITEYAEVATNGSLSDITADISGSDVRILVDVNNNNSTVSVYATLLP
jgi:molybdopterin-binding protein